MSKIRKFQIIEWVILIIYIGIILVFAKIEGNKPILESAFLIPLIIITVIMVVAAVYLENKVSKLKNIEKEEKLAKEKENTKKTLFERSQFNDMVNMMYQLYIGSSNEVNELLDKHNLEMDYLYDDEEDEDWFYIESKMYDRKLKEIYIFELSGDGRIILDNNEEVDMSSKTFDELVEFIVNDIKTFFKEEE